MYPREFHWDLVEGVNEVMNDKEVLCIVASGSRGAGRLVLDSRRHDRPSDGEGMTRRLKSLVAEAL